MRRSFFAWFGDILCGLAAYTLSRWIWQKHGEGVFSHLLEELGTFAGAFVLLRLMLKAAGVARRNAKAAKQLRPGP